MAVAKKLDLAKADVEIGGVMLTTCMNLEWNDSFKSADTVKNGKLISTADAEEQTKGKLEMEQWEAGVIEKELREGSLRGTLAGLIASVTIADADGRFFKAKQVRFTKGAVKWDEKASDDKTPIEFDVLGDFEADIHGGLN